MGRVCLPYWVGVVPLSTEKIAIDMLSTVNRPTVTRVEQSETAEVRIMQFSPYSSSHIFVLITPFVALLLNY